MLPGSVRDPDVLYSTRDFLPVKPIKIVSAILKANSANSGAKRRENALVAEIVSA
jgi:hypothetical protein